MKKFLAIFKKKGGKAAKGYRKIERKPFKITKLNEIDDFFSKLQEPMDTLCDLSEALATINEGINLLMESKEIVENNVERTPRGVFTFMKTDCKKSGNDFTLVVGENGIPSLEPRDEPQGFSAKIYVEVKKMCDAIKDIIENAPGLQGQVQDAAAASKDLPNKVKSDAATAGLNPLDTAKAAKHLADNIKYLTGFPNDVIELINNAKELATIIKDVFGGGNEGSKEEGGEKEEKEDKE